LTSTSRRFWCTLGIASSTPIHHRALRIHHISQLSIILPIYHRAITNNVVNPTASTTAQQRDPKTRLSFGISASTSPIAHSKLQSHFTTRCRPQLHLRQPKGFHPSIPLPSAFSPSAPTLDRSISYSFKLI
jgi:hypothetical protein